MPSGRLDYGDYEGEFDLCACGRRIALGETECRSCSQKRVSARREAASLERKFARHRIRKWWDGTRAEAEIAAYLVTLKSRVARAVRSARTDAA